MLVHGAYPVHMVIESVPKMYPIYIKRYNSDIPDGKMCPEFGAAFDVALVYATDKGLYLCHVAIVTRVL